MTGVGAASPFSLERNGYGRLVLRVGDDVWENVLPVRSFPLSAPEEGIALVSADSKERVWIDRLDSLDEASRQLIVSELEQREFVPVITGLDGVSGFTTPCTWRVQTDRGPTSFVLKSEEAIRRLSSSRLLISDAQGVQYLVPDLHRLDRPSRKLIDRFL
jgi:hypothetical protein